MADAAHGPVLALTTGEPAGVGPELALRLAATAPSAARPVAVGDPALLAERAAMLGLSLSLPELAPGEPVPAARAGVLPVWPVALREPSRPGVLATANADYVLETLDVAVGACRAGHAAGMITAPLHKGVILDAGHVGFTGHTEYLRDACGIDEVVMMLATDRALHAAEPTWRGGGALRVALATTHLPLRDVADAIRAPRLARTLRILHGDLRRWFAVERPRIAVCGLNPHAGEGGHLGREELEVIAPCLDALRGEGLDLDGPLPADTLFTPRHLAGVDAVLAMYHDQGLPVLKYAGFGRAANITLGLPFPRTSVDHGTALDLAGSGRADPGSLAVAVALAAEMTSRGDLKAMTTP
ncbi:4-hydroxythreonine-4-phosphate dehydrogenase PdxA [Halomonas campisalis]|uniref:4-hydroxythreonine-4-phosphate dehydrogenase n=1 Tax=Billgrantia campisalis TaxID=74661 RepID=A0ABS9P7H2_9GAMM|nr:4-hydroxythreonine-4-phosphate dehydrogenase PdxA [Halomonas campisalis]MCG6657725.1 4-hydroxythreonine-4-phosphate dehydrogenase PdxA [Halomonas campisalis]MDR5862503.1 4-hydroxythreonine-4-phosphate dehydrogenase PdxA [Halomonas campisalis]